MSFYLNILNKIYYRDIFWGYLLLNFLLLKAMLSYSCSKFWKSNTPPAAQIRVKQILPMLLKYDLNKWLFSEKEKTGRSFETMQQSGVAAMPWSGNNCGHWNWILWFFTAKLVAFWMSHLKLHDYIYVYKYTYICIPLLSSFKLLFLVPWRNVHWTFIPLRNVPRMKRPPRYIIL
jgi:hypothetical protein